MLSFVVALLVQTSGLEGAGPPPKTPISVEDEVVGNILAQPLGTGTVADLALPDDFLRRVADRILRASFAENYRIVVRDPGTPASVPPIADEPAPSSSEPATIAGPARAGDARPKGAPGAREPKQSWLELLKTTSAVGYLKAIGALALGAAALAFLFLVVRAARRAVR